MSSRAIIAHVGRRGDSRPYRKGKAGLSYRLMIERIVKAPRMVRRTLLVISLATVLVPVLLSPFDYSVAQLILAMVLLDICLYPTFRYVARKEAGLPIMPALCLAFAVQYAIPIFTQESKIELLMGETFYLENRAVVATLFLTILSVLVLQLTYYCLRNAKAITVIPFVNLNLSETRAEIFCVGVFLLSLMSGRIQSILSEELARQFLAVFTLIQTQLLVAIVILAWLAFGLRKRKRHLFMLYFLVPFTAFRGFSTTMLETIVLPLAVLFISKWAFTKKLPVFGLATVALAFLFFSPVKMDIRKAAMEEATIGRSGSTTTRAADWITQASEFWWEAISGRRELAESTMSASSRTDLIHQFAQIYAMTPSDVPYQYGSTYSYFAVTFVPRILWPDKPQANYANRFYALAYGISNEEGLQTSSFGVSMLGEGYVNFGFVGPLLSMLFFGLVLVGCEHVFGSARSGPGGQAIFLGVFVFFLNGIGTSTEIMFGGVIQNLVSCSLLLWWVRKVPLQRAVS